MPRIRARHEGTRRLVDLVLREHRAVRRVVRSILTDGVVTSGVYRASKAQRSPVTGKHNSGNEHFRAGTRRNAGTACRNAAVIDRELSWAGALGSSNAGTTT